MGHLCWGWVRYQHVHFTLWLATYLALTGLLEHIGKSSSMSSLFICRNFTILIVYSKTNEIDEIRMLENTSEREVLEYIKK